MKLSSRLNMRVKERIECVVRDEVIDNAGDKL